VQKCFANARVDFLLFLRPLCEARKLRGVFCRVRGLFLPVASAAPPGGTGSLARVPISRSSTAADAGAQPESTDLVQQSTDPVKGVAESGWRRDFALDKKVVAAQRD